MSRAVFTSKQTEHLKYRKSQIKLSRDKCIMNFFSMKCLTNQSEPNIRTLTNFCTFKS